MAILTYTVEVTGVPTLLFAAPADGDGSRVYITNNDQVNHIWIGGANVTSTTGYEVTNLTGTGVGNRADFQLYGGEKLYVVCAATKTATVAVIASGA